MYLIYINNIQIDNNLADQTHSLLTIREQVPKPSTTNVQQQSSDYKQRGVKREINPRFNNFRIRTRNGRLTTL